MGGHLLPGVATSSPKHDTPAAEPGPTPGSLAGSKTGRLRIFGKGGKDRLFGDADNDDVSGGDQGDRIQGGTGWDDLFGQAGNDFVNAFDGRPNDRVDCGESEFDIAGIDDFTIFSPFEKADEVALSCEVLYVGVPIIGNGGLASEGTRSDSGTNLSAIDTRIEAERAEADGLLRQIR